MDRSILRVHGPLALAALFISSVIWLMARQGELQSDQLTVSVTLEGVPENVDVEYSPRIVPVLVKFPQNQRGRIVAQNFSLIIDLNRKLGPDPRTWGGVESPQVHRIALAIEDIVANDIPPSVRVTEFVGPSQIEVQARLQIATLPVEIQTAGELPASYELKAPLRAEPEQVLVTAPYTELQRVRDEGLTLKTREVQLTGRTTDFIDLPGLLLPPTLTLVRDADKNVQVFALIREKDVTRSISDVPIELFVVSEKLGVSISPPTAEIRLRGKISLVSQVNDNSFVFSPKEFLPEEAGVRKRIELSVAFKQEVPLEIREGVKIEGQMPALVEVAFVPREGAVSEEEGENAEPDAPEQESHESSPQSAVTDLPTSPTL